QDMRPDGMLHGRVVRPPRYGSKLDSVGEDAARAVPGVVAVVRDGSFLGVVAEREEQAINARQALAAGAVWSSDGPRLPDPRRLKEALKQFGREDKLVNETASAGAAPAH